MSSVTQIGRFSKRNRANQVQWANEPLLKDQQGYCYYPGGGRDWSPINRYADEDLFDFFVYADYIVSMNDVINSLTIDLNGFQIIDTTELGPGTSNGFLRDWADYYEPGADWGDPNNGYLLRVRLLTPMGRTITLFYFGTEAIGTIRILTASVGRPLMVVVQDHGLGGYWTPFGGSSQLYQAFLRYIGPPQNQKVVRRFLPRFIYVAEGTDAWPSYLEFSELEEQTHDMYGVPKRLFRLQLQR
jgi:hypothetical protein